MIEALITLCPNPYHILQLGHYGIIDLFHDHGYRCGPKTADKILSVVQRSLLPPSDVTPAFATILQREFEHYQFLASQHQKGIDTLERLLPTTVARHLLPIPGTSPHLVARYLTGVGNVSDILFADQVWAKAGMNPSVYISGDVIIHGDMSKQGDPFFRDTLYLLGYQLGLHCAYFGDAFTSTGSVQASKPSSAASTKLKPPFTPPTRSIGSSFISCNTTSLLTHQTSQTTLPSAANGRYVCIAIWLKKSNVASARPGDDDVPGSVADAP